MANVSSTSMNTNSAGMKTPSTIGEGNFSISTIMPNTIVVSFTYTPGPSGSIHPFLMIFHMECHLLGFP